MSDRNDDAHNYSNFRGRGAGFNPHNRFEKSHTLAYEGEEPLLMDERTTLMETFPKTILNKVSSPDLFPLSINPYQGCEHGCVYCYARNTHEYWGLSAGLDFERKIIVKKNAPELLIKELSNKNHTPQPIMFSGNTDCYQPAERELKITRRLLEVFLKYKHPVALITKNALIKRDIDILSEMAHHRLVMVMISVTGVDENLRRKMEPRTSTHAQRIDTIRALSEAGIPTGVLFAPVIPALNSHEMPEVLQQAANAGATTASFNMIRLNGQVAPLFRNWLDNYFPDRSDKVWNQIKELHGGQVNDSRFNVRMKGEGPLAESLNRQFAILTHKLNFNKNKMNWNLSDFNPDAGNPQLSIF